MTRGLHLELTETRAELPVTRERWNALAAENPTHTAFQTFEWFDTWWTAFGASHQLFLLTLQDAGTVHGIFPLMRMRGALGLRHLEFTGTPNADYQDFILPAHRTEAIRLLCEYLYSVRDRWDMLVLRNLPDESPTGREISDGFRRLGLGIMDMEREPCPVLLIRGRETEVENLLNRYSIRRAVRNLGRQGPLRYQRLESPEQIDGNLPDFYEQHRHRWAVKEDESSFARQQYRDWYRALAHAAARAGWLHFSRLDCGAKAAAFHFGFGYGDRLAWYKPSYNPQFGELSPGTVLIRHLIDDAQKQNLGEFDFSAGFEPFKDRFSNLQRSNCNLRIFSNRAIYLAFRSGGQLRNLARDAWRRWRAR